MNVGISRHTAVIIASIAMALMLQPVVEAQGTLKVYISPPAAQSTTVSGVTTETFDNLSTGIKTSAYNSSGVGTYTGSSTNPFGILAHDVYGGGTDSGHTSPTNYMAVGKGSNSTHPVNLTLSNPASYFGFWWSAGDASNRIDLYSGSTLYATFSTQDLLNFLNNGSGNVTAINGTQYATSGYFGNPNLSSGSNDGSEPFVYVSFVMTGASINKLAFYNLNTSSSFENDNHSVIFTGNTVTIPTTFVSVETLNLTPTVATPTFSPAAGTYTSVQSVTISTTTSGSTIRYTMDGSTPSETVGTVYSTPVSVGATSTLKAIAYKSGLADSGVASAAYTINLPVVATPTFNPVAGAYTSSQTVTMSSTTSGSTIRYTTDGSTPSETVGTVYSTGVTVGVNTTIKAIAYKSGMADSSVASGAYTIAAAAPTFSPAAGTYTAVQSVTISSATSGSTIRYTTDGSTPSETAGTVYSVPVSVGSTTTLKAIAYKSGMADSAVSSAAYTINLPVVAAPSFNPTAGSYTSPQSVTLTSTSGAIIRYTTDGSTPSETVGTIYSGAIAVTANTTVKAIAYMTGMADSAVTSAAYTIAAAVPTFNPAAGSYTSPQSVTLTSTSGATIRYTTDGSTPTETAGTVYSAPVVVSSTTTVKAIAYKSGMADSAVASAVYTINLAPVAAPTFNPVAGSYASAQSVVISSTTSGATIRYTTDGSAPSETVGTVYSVPFAVSANTTIKAIAYMTGMADSAVASAAYTIAAAVPTFSPLAGSYTSPQSVTLTSTSGATIRYTTDGSTPSETVGTVYSVPFAVSANTTIKAIAYMTGMADSSIASAAYTIASALPTFSPAGGSFASPQSVTISSTPGATIRYTTDGSTPSETAGTVYATPIT